MVFLCIDLKFDINIITIAPFTDMYTFFVSQLTQAKMPRTRRDSDSNRSSGSEYVKSPVEESDSDPSASEASKDEDEVPKSKSQRLRVEFEPNEVQTIERRSVGVVLEAEEHILQFDLKNLGRPPKPPTRTVTSQNCTVETDLLT